MLVVGIAAAAVALWVTLRAGFLAYPGWLAVQKADFILGPIGVGLYWHYKRPDNRLGLLLICLGLVGVPYILTSLSNPTLFGLGIAFEVPIYVLTSAVILAFPSGRIEGLAAKLILAVSVVGNVVAYAVLLLTDPQAGPGFSISGCRGACPANGLAIWSTPTWFSTYTYAYGRLLFVIPIATACVLVWRFIDGTPPRRRALLIGAPVALLFLAMQASYRFLFFLSPDGLAASHAPVHSDLQWTFAGARSFVWYGFLFALIAAELYAGRVLRRLNRESLGRPTFRQLEGLLRVPLGDPGLRLGFWQAESREWTDGDGGLLAPPGAGQEATEVDRDGNAAIAIVHDEQLSEDPELLQAAGAVALMALENAELDTAWRQAMHDLRDSRARLSNASDNERRKLAQDLHDGAQQRLVAIQISLQLLKDDEKKSHLDERLEAIREDTGEAIEDLRTLAHGMYPTLLGDYGLAGALRSVAARTPLPTTVTDKGIGRCSPAVEATLYFCALEAVQNALKHAGSDAHITIVVGRDQAEAYFSVADDGVGMATTGAGDGMGLAVMRDRMGTVGGELEVVSSPGTGTTIRGVAPAGGFSPVPPPTVGGPPEALYDERPGQGTTPVTVVPRPVAEETST